MVDKVDGTGLGHLRRPDSAAKASPGASEGGEKPAVDAVAPNQFNSADAAGQSTYEQLKTEVANSQEVSRQKVDEIKAAISRGEFQVDPQRVAQAVIELEQILSA